MARTQGNGSWPLKGDWPLNRGKNNRKGLIETLIRWPLNFVMINF